MGKLNALFVRKAKPGRHQDGDGLFLDVRQSGRRSWVVRLQVNRQRRDFGLGPYPAVSLLEAREQALETRKQVRRGIDPSATKRALRALETAMPTFREAAIQAHSERREGWRNGKHQAQWLATLERYAFPSLGNLKVDKVDAPAIRDLLQPIWLTIPETARRVLQRIGTVLDWAHSKGFRSSETPTRSVLRGLKKQPKRDRHFAALAYPELPALMQALTHRQTVSRMALRFLILTAARSGEVRRATWEEIDLDEGVWTIPAERMKAGREHIVPLNAGALAALKEAKELRTGRAGEWIFPGNGGKPLSDMTLTKLLRIVRPGPATVHGFRSSFRDWAAEQTDIDGAVVEAALAHTVANKVEASYRRTNYLEKRRGLMQLWSDFASK